MATAARSNDFEVLVKSFLRFDKVRTLVESVRRHYPGCVIRIADDSPDGHERDEALDRLAAAGCVIYRLPFDVGLSAGRNHLLQAVEAPFFVLTDDDKVFTRLTRIDRLRAVLDADPRCLLAAGMNLDYGVILRYQHGDIQRDGSVLRRTLFGARAPVVVRGGVRTVPCRLTPNFFLARTALFREHGVAWDDRFKLGDGEHAWFFARLPPEVNLYVVPEVRVAHFPSRAGGDTYQRFRYDRGEARRFTNELGVRVITTWAYETWRQMVARRALRAATRTARALAPRFWRTDAAGRR